MKTTSFLRRAVTAATAVVLSLAVMLPGTIASAVETPADMTMVEIQKRAELKRGACTVHNLDSLVFDKDKEIHASDIKIEALNGYRLTPGMKYLAHPGCIHRFTEDGQYADTVMLKDSGGERDLCIMKVPDMVDEAACSKAAGFKAMPDFRWSLDNLDISKSVICFTGWGTDSAIGNAKAILVYNSGADKAVAADKVQLNRSVFVRTYDPYMFASELLNGRPVIMMADAKGVPNESGQFAKVECGISGKTVPVVLQGFFICGDRLGFEVYSPGASGKTASQLFVWEDDLRCVGERPGAACPEFKRPQTDIPQLVFTYAAEKR